MIARQSTARTFMIGPVLDADGVAVTDGVIADVKLSKNGGVPAALDGSATLTHRHTGHYSLAATANDFDTVGTAQFALDDTVNACPPVNFQVVEEAVYDQLYAASAPGAATPTAVSAVETDTQDIQTRLPAALTAGGNIKADALAFSGSTTAADNAEVVLDTDFADAYNTTANKWEVDVTHWGSAAIEVPTVAGVPNTNTEYADGVPIGVSVAADKLIIAEGTIGSTGNDTTHLHLTGLAHADDGLNDLLIRFYDNSTGLYHSRWITDWVAATDLATLDEALPATPENAVDTYTVLAVERNVTATADTAAIADAVWDEAIAGHLGAGSTGEALNAAGSAGDPWVTALPGAYGAGSAGFILGTNLNATISSRASQTSVDDVPTVAEFEARTLVAANYFDPAADAVATVTNLTNLPSIPANWLTAAGIAAGALDGKGNWNVGKTGYALSATGLDLVTTWTVGITGNITGNLSGSVGSVTGAVGSVTGAVGSVTGTVGGIAGTITTLDALDTAQDVEHDATQAAIAALNNLSSADVTAAVPTVAQIWTTALTEAYRATGAAGTAAQLIHEILQNLTEFTIAGTTKTVKKFDAATTAKTYTLNDSVSPTGITETT